MLRKFRSHLHHNVVAYVALFVALGGTASALAANSVGTSQLRPFSVRSTDLGSSAVTSAKIATSAVGARALRATVVHESSTQVKTGGTQSVEAQCAPGEQVIGAGTRWEKDSGSSFDSSGASVSYTSLLSTATGQGARARGSNSSKSTLRLVVQALCLGG
jgi:hypothetical protein